MFTERGQGLIRWGAVLLALSVLSGFAIMVVPDPIMGLASHIQGLLNAFLIILIGLIWSRLEVGYLASVVIYWGLIIGGYVTFLVQMLCTFLEIGGGIFPLAGGSHTGTPLEEMLVKRAVQGAALLTSVAIILVARGAIRKPAI
jgi:hydroxylaminobenzene mutase